MIQEQFLILSYNILTSYCKRFMKVSEKVVNEKLPNEIFLV